LLRIKYLNRMADFEAEGRPMVYVDETWINKNCTPKNSWHDGTVDTSLNVPHGKGPRWIVIGAGGRMGWIPNSFRMWKGNVQSEDYHTEMNGLVFQEWVHDFLLPNVPANAVIVMDRATYHMVMVENTKAASSSCRKDQLIQWLIEHDAKDDDGILYDHDRLLLLRKSELLELCQDRKPTPKHLIFEWLRAWNAEHDTDIQVNILPVAHPRLNAIEMMWNWLKTHVAKHNTQFTMSSIQALAQARKLELDATWWAKACTMAEKFAKESREVDDMEPMEGELRDSEDEDDQDQYFDDNLFEEDHVAEIDALVEEAPSTCVVC